MAAGRSSSPVSEEGGRSVRNSRPAPRRKHSCPSSPAARRAAILRPPLPDQIVGEPRVSGEEQPIRVHVAKGRVLARTLDPVLDKGVVGEAKQDALPVSWASRRVSVVLPAPSSPLTTIHGAARAGRNLQPARSCSCRLSRTPSSRVGSRSGRRWPRTVSICCNSSGENGRVFQRGDIFLDLLRPARADQDGRDFRASAGARRSPTGRASGRGAGRCHSSLRIRSDLSVAGRAARHRRPVLRSEP